MNKQDVGAAIRKAVQLFSKSLEDSDVLKVGALFDVWKPDTIYKAGGVVNHGEVLYKIMVDHTSQAHQPPDSPGMLAIYRPIAEETPGAGSIGNPILWINGMDCYSGKYYISNGIKYLCKADMLPCVWAPGTPGVWQWEPVV